MARPGDRLTGKLFAHVDADLITAPADRRSQMDCQLVGRQTVPRQRLNRLGGYLSDRPSPSRMNKCDNPRRMRDEDGDAVGHANGQRSPLFGRDVTVSFAAAQPAFPATGVNEDSIAMNLANRNQSARNLRQIPLHRAPTAHHFFDGIVAGESEGAGSPGGRERADSPRLEVGDDFLGDFGQLSVCDRQRE